MKNKEKKEFEIPSINIIEVDKDDIIATSGLNGDNYIQDPWGDLG